MSHRDSYSRRSPQRRYRRRHSSRARRSYSRSESSSSISVERPRKKRNDSRDRRRNRRRSSSRSYSSRDSRDRHRRSRSRSSRRRDRHRRSKSSKYSKSDSYHDRSGYGDSRVKETTSLMVKFTQSDYLNPEVDDAILLDIFEKFAQVKDIRLIRDRNYPDQYRNFVFVEYFTIEDARKVLESAKRDPITIKDERVYIKY